jgi:putative tributyrin esterase
MALIHCNFKSEVLGLHTSMYVILPQISKEGTSPDNHTLDTKHPTLYLLHGLSDPESAWIRKTSIERYVAPLGLAVVMPTVHRSFYTDMANGHRYWTFISEELPAIARELFPLSDRREDNFVAGLSMGGYGAFKLALSHPDRFMAAASLSGALDIPSRIKIAEPSMQTEFRNIFGDFDRVAGSDNDLLHLLGKVAGSDGPKPMMYQYCGTEDFLYEGNLNFLNKAKSLPIDITYEEEPGDHQWFYWDKKIQTVLNWLPLKARKQVWIN